MTEKSFSIENPSQERKQNYKERILSVINDIEEQIRLVIPDQMVHNEIHQERVVDIRNEAKEHQVIRTDITETFGVPNDDKHVFVLDDFIDQNISKKRRALRAFIVLIDTLHKESFYGEGRTAHAILLNSLDDMRREVTEEDVSEEDFKEGLNAVPPRFILFKGFLSNDKFSTLSDSTQSIIKTPIFDKNGEVIETPDTWFLTGHSLEGMSPSKE